MYLPIPPLALILALAPTKGRAGTMPHHAYHIVSIHINIVYRQPAQMVQAASAFARWTWVRASPTMMGIGWHGMGEMIPHILQHQDVKTEDSRFKISSR
jgi:hypothetical protein